MSDKLCSFLFICLLASFQIGCRAERRAAAINIPDDKQAAEIDVSDEEIKMLFIDSGLGKGDGNLEKLTALPADRVISVVRKIKANGVAKGEKGFQSETQSETLKVKSAYFLWSLGVDAPENEKYIVDAAKSKDSYLRFDALGWLSVLIREGKKEYLPLILNAAPEADGHYAEGLHELFVAEMENAPKIFLEYLSREPLKVRKAVYELLSFVEESSGRETVEKINANVEKLKREKNLKIIAAEFLREVNKRR